MDPQPPPAQSRTDETSSTFSGCPARGDRLDGASYSLENMATGKETDAEWHRFLRGSVSAGGEGAVHDSETRHLWEAHQRMRKSARFRLQKAERRQRGERQ